MKKIVPFKKDIIFKTNLAEITSISLEHTLQIDEEHLVYGTFIVSGEYKMSENSVHTDPFSYDLPFDISMDERYNLEKANVDIDDFYYEIINSNVLSVHIDVLLDHLEEVIVPEPEIISVMETAEEKEFLLDEVREEENMEEPILEEKKIEVTELNIEPRCIEEEDVLPKKKEVPAAKEETEETRIASVSDTVTSLFDQMGTESETYQSYKVYIVREGDSIETIMERYSVTQEQMAAYNELSEIKLGDKLIIPSTYA